MTPEEREQRIEELVSIDGPLEVDEAEELNRLARERRQDRR